MAVPCKRSGSAGNLLTVYVSLAVRTVLPSPLLGRSAALGFFPRTVSSLVFVGVDPLKLRRVAIAEDLLTSCISDELSEAVNVWSLRVLRCLLALGCVVVASGEGLGRLLLLRTVDGAVPFAEGENMLSVFYGVAIVDLTYEEGNGVALLVFGLLSRG